MCRKKIIIKKHWRLKGLAEIELKLKDERNLEKLPIINTQP